jgi:hypothetical protein
MSYVPVEICLANSKQTAQRLTDVLIHLYSEDGRTLFTTAMTDAEGKARFLLPARTYQVRVYKVGTTFHNPIYLVVHEDASGEAFTIFGEVLDRDVATGPYMCRASCRILDGLGNPRPGISFTFTPDDSLVSMGGTAMMVGVPCTVVTDERGYVWADLLQGAIYRVRMSISDTIRRIFVPMASSWSLTDLVLPYVGGVMFAGESERTLTVGETLELDLTVYHSDGQQSDFPTQELEWTNSAPNLCSHSFRGSTLVLYAQAPGTAVITAQRIQKNYEVYPRPGIQNLPITITVVEA